MVDPVLEFRVWLGRLVQTVAADVVEPAVHGAPNAAILDPAVSEGDEPVRAFFSKYCFECHGPEKQKGERRFDQLQLPVAHTDTLIELQDARVAPLANTSGYPLAFPRPGSRKLFENERVVVWTFTWTQGVATPMHFHDKDVVVTYLADGALTSTDRQGKSAANEVRFGLTRFNARDRVHTEMLARGQGRAMMVELK